MIADEIKEGKFFIQEGVIHTLQPLNNWEDVMKEVTAQVEEKLKVANCEETVVREIGRASAYLTQNDWKVHFFNPKDFAFLCPFDGDLMEGKFEHVDDKGERTTRVEKVYIPEGYLAFRISINDQSFPNINVNIFLLPKLDGIEIEHLFQRPFVSAFSGVHPHVFGGGKLCAGINAPHKFDIDLIITKLLSCATGNKDEETTLFDYNASSPATNIESCRLGKNAVNLKADGKTDQEIWQEIMKERSN